MAPVNTYLVAVSVILSIANIVTADFSKLDLETSVCKLLKDKFAGSNPWVAYPIVYDTITVGRLNIWTGVSSLPTSEFRCYSPKNATNEIDLVFANFVNRLEWTFYDMSKGLTYYGVTVKNNEDVKYRVKIKNKQADSYLECNTVDDIELIASDDDESSIQTSCLECSASTLSLINSQLNKLLKSRLNLQITENLYWHISQLLTNQHFSAPLPIDRGN